jgi:Uma2 family endonuclease
VITQKLRQVHYPESDGKPMADNTEQFHWIVTIKENLESMFAEDENVFIAGDLLWYPVQGDNKIANAPDTMVVFGRPKGYRGSYQQWNEGNIPPQVVFEILSPGNRTGEMERKRQFYERHGVEEYYLYSPERLRLQGWLRQGNSLENIPEMNGWISPRLGIRFAIEVGEGLIIYRPNGEQFLRFTEQVQRRQNAEIVANLALERADSSEIVANLALERADRAEITANLALERADSSALEANLERQRADRAEITANLALERADSIELEANIVKSENIRLLAKLKELGIELD